MKFRPRTVQALAHMICGNPEAGKHFVYRSSSYLSRFFRECDTEYRHDGSTRGTWVEMVIEKILEEPHSNAQTPPRTFATVIELLMDPEDASEEGSDRPEALAALNLTLAREGFKAFYGSDKKCHLRHVATNTVASPDPHRPFTQAEMDRRARLAAHLDKCSEDDLIEKILLPMLRQFGFQRITAAGHKDKALEYGKDVWMRLHAADHARSLLRHSGKEGKARRGWDAEGWQREHR